MTLIFVDGVALIPPTEAQISKIREPLTTSFGASRKLSAGSDWDSWLMTSRGGKRSYVHFCLGTIVEVGYICIYVFFFIFSAAYHQRVVVLCQSHN